MDKVGIISDQVDMDLEKALRVCRDMGLEYVELHSFWDKNIEDLTKEEVGRTVELVKQYDLKVSNVSSTLFLMCPIDGSERQLADFHDYFLTVHGSYADHLEALKRCFELADRFDTSWIRIFGFRELEDVQLEDALETVTERLRQPVALAEAAGKTLLLENCPFSYVGTGAQAARVIKAIGSAHLQALWDPGNALRWGATPYPADYEVIRPYIQLMHVSDYKAREDGSFADVLLGTGEVPYGDILPALHRSDYQGIISSEPEHLPELGPRAEGSRQSIEVLRRMLAEAAGAEQE